MAFFKYMVKSIAEKHGLRATFMPKPFANLTGSGCHVHVSLWQGDKNLFDDGKDELGLSRTAYNFIGGVMNAASELCAITNPTVNSYKRINAPVTTSGATWSPNTVTYAGNNRTHMIRIPGGGRFEFRLADGAANPYLLPAAMLAAGLDGIARSIDPGKPLDIDMYAEGHKAPAGTKKLPLNLLDALRITERLRAVAARARRRVRQLLHQAQDAGVERLFAPPHRVGARQHARLLDALLIRDPRPEDEAAWRRLWAGYVAFYEAEVSEDVTAATWRRLFTPDSNMLGRIAEWQGDVAGFTVSIIHPGSWTLAPLCYLEDLFVDPDARGHGIGQALIQDLIDIGRKRGWSRLYWHTRASNETARRLYDKFVTADDFVRYRMILG